MREVLRRVMRAWLRPPPFAPRHLGRSALCAVPAHSIAMVAGPALRPGSGSPSIAAAVPVAQPRDRPRPRTMDTRRVLKLVVVGEGNVGKTSLVRRYATHKFAEARTQTLGIDITTQDRVIAGSVVTLALWDIEGQRGERPFFYHGASAALLVYDVTAPDSLRALLLWIDRLRHHAPPGLPLLIVGNKADLPSAVPVAWGEALAAGVGARGHYRVSARADAQVGPAFALLADMAAASARQSA